MLSASDVDPVSFDLCSPPPRYQPSFLPESVSSSRTIRSHPGQSEQPCRCSTYMRLMKAESVSSYYTTPSTIGQSLSLPQRLARHKKRSIPSRQPPAQAPHPHELGRHHGGEPQWTNHRPLHQTWPAGTTAQTWSWMPWRVVSGITEQRRSNEAGLSPQQEPRE